MLRAIQRYGKNRQGSLVSLQAHPNRKDTRSSLGSVTMPNGRIIHVRLVKCRSCGGPLRSHRVLGSDFRVHPQELEKQFDTIRDEIICPHCGRKGSCIKWGWYERGLTELTRSGDVADSRIRIRRVMCGGCGHTHGILPVGIVPYRRYSLPFIMEAVEVWTRTREVTRITTRLKIAPATLYAWAARMKEDVTRSGQGGSKTLEVWIEDWRDWLTDEFLQLFLLTNFRLPMENTRPIRPVRGQNTANLPTPSSWFFQWPAA